MNINNMTIWLKNNASFLQSKNVTLEKLVFSPNSSYNPGCYADLLSKCSYGRITLWESGACDIEALDESGDSILWEHRDLNNDVDLDKALRDLVDVMACRT
jgi:hypothetical protein